MSQLFANIYRNFMMSAFCLLLAFSCLFGVTSNAFAQTPEKPIIQSLKLVSLYDSGWRYDTNTSDHTTIIEHELGRLPRLVQVFFSPDKSTIFPVRTYIPAQSGNPVTVSANDKSVSLTIYQGIPLYGVWNPGNGWTSFTSGYWKVVLL